jgi:PAS domain S-box-containing protein
MARAGTAAGKPRRGEQMPQAEKRHIKRRRKDPNGEATSLHGTSTATDIGLVDFAESSTDSFLLFDGELNCVGINPAGLKLLHLAEDTVVDANLLDIMPEAKDSGVYEELLTVLKTGKHIATSARRGRRLVGIKAFKVGDGLGMIASDITERRRVEESQGADGGWDMLFNALEGSMLVVDREFSVANVTDDGLSLLRRDREDVVGEKCYRVLCGESRPGRLCPLRKALETGKEETMERELLGSRFCVKASPVRDENSEIDKILLQLRDISSRKEIEDYLRVREALMAFCPVAVATAGPDGRITYANQSFLRMWGHRKAASVAGKEWASLWGAEEEAGEVLEAANRAGSWTGRMAARNRNGTKFDVELSARLIKDESGSPLCVAACALDLTQQDLLQERLNEYENRFNALAAKSMGWAERLNTVMKSAEELVSRATAIIEQDSDEDD